MFGCSIIGPGGKDCADMITFREERGANTEPTGLGMERWYVFDCNVPPCSDFN